MAANMIEAARNDPGATALVIVGASTIKPAAIFMVDTTGSLS
jgi:hypothetical protein